MRSDADLRRAGLFHRRRRRSVGPQRDNAVALTEFRLESCDQSRAKPTAPPINDTHAHRLRQPLTGRRHGEFAMLHHDDDW